MPHYKLIDYSHPTSGELARLIFQYKEITYEDEKVDSPDRIYEAEEDSPFGHLPVLLVDGKHVAHGQGICRYLARKFDLVGKNDEEAATCDMIMDGLGVMFSQMRDIHVASLDVKQQVALLKKMMEEDVPRYLSKYEKFLERSGLSRGYFASEQITWCDLGVGLTLAGLQIRQPKLMDQHPRLKAFVNKMISHPIVEDFVQSELAQSVIIRKNSMS